jgi:hypothetical protein
MNSGFARPVDYPSRLSARPLVIASSAAAAEQTRYGKFRLIFRQLACDAGVVVGRPASR